MIEIIKIVNTHGVKGEFKGIYYADSTDFFQKVAVLKDAKGNSYHILNAREYKGAMLFNIEGISDMTSAEKLKGMSLYAKREDFPPLPEGEYYLADLIGLKAVTDKGEDIGIVKNIIEKAAQNLLEIEADDKRDILIPNCEPFVRTIDLEKGEIVIVPIEGLI